MRKREGIALFISLLLHASVAYLLYQQQKECKLGGPPAQPPIHIEIVSPPTEAEVESVAQPQKAEIDEQADLITKQLQELFEKIKEKNYTPAKPECKKFYEGIGITHDYRTDRVISVPAGYPAHRAGIQVGDIVVPVDQPDIKGPMGTAVTVLVNRNGETFTLTIIRDKICTE